MLRDLKRRAVLCSNLAKQYAQGIRVESVYPFWLHNRFDCAILSVRGIKPRAANTILVLRRRQPRVRLMHGCGTRAGCDAEGERLVGCAVYTLRVEYRRCNCRPRVVDFICSR